MEGRRKCSGGDHSDPTEANIKRYAGKDAGLGLGLPPPPLCAKFKVYAENLAVGGGRVRTARALGKSQIDLRQHFNETIILE